MKVIWVRSTHVPDSRFLKYEKAARACGVEMHVVQWNRAGKSAKGEGVTQIGVEADIGGGWRNVIALVRWNIQLTWTLMRLAKSCTHIHAVDLDSIVPCLLVGKMFGKKVIFEIYDEYADARNVPEPFAGVAKWIQRCCARASEGLIVPDECRFSQIGLTPTQHSIVIENVPTRMTFSPVATDRHHARLKLVYVGVLQADCRGLEDLIAVISEDPTVSLDVAGDGPLASLFRQASGRFENIQYHGPVPYERALGLMATADVLVGLYYLNNRNHRYAAPNKFFEHLMLGKALLTSAHTPPGDRVQKMNTGWAIEDGQASLREWLQGATQAEAQEKGARAREAWSDLYENYDEYIVTPRYSRLLGISCGR